MPQKIFNLKKSTFLVGISIFVFIFVTTFPPKTHAGVSCLFSTYGSTGSAAATNQMAVATHDDTTQNNTGSQKTATCILNSLAQAAARSLIQQMTASIVNWINSGFNGNPSFLTNPAGFMENLVDQTTGAFLGANGPLNSLCSSFGLDIRLNLALSQANTLQQRYTCTLSKVLQNLSSGPHIGISISSSLNGFTNDFSQGGWPAFVEMSMEPQNNVYGAWIMADSDQKLAISEQQKTLNNDLNRGNGFMSWQKCTTLAADSSSDSAYDSLGISSDQYSRLRNNGYVSTGANAGIKTTTDPGTGAQSYERCTTETPGSFISGSLQKQTGASVDAVVNIQDIDQAIAQIGQSLMGQALGLILQNGLAQVSNSGSSGGNATQSLINQLSAAQSQNSLDETASVTVAGLDDSIAFIKNYLSTKHSAVDVLSAEKPNYATALACFVGRPGGDTADVNIVTNGEARLDVAIAKYQALYDSAASSTNINALQDLETRISNAASADEVNSLSDEFNAYVQNVHISSDDINQAQNDLTDASHQANLFHNESIRFENICQTGGMITSTSTTPTLPTQS